MLRYKHKQYKQKRIMSRTTKTRRRYSNRISIICFLVFLVLALIATIIILFIIKPQKIKQSKQNTEVQSQQIQPGPTDSSNESKLETEKQEDFDAGKTPQTPKQYEETDTEHSSSLTGSITYSGKNSNNLIIRVTINQLLKESGTCLLSLTSTNDQKIERTVNTIDNPSSATCQGFDIPLTEIPVGNYQINIEIKTTHQKGNIKGSVVI